MPTMAQTQGNGNDESTPTTIHTSSSSTSMRPPSTDPTHSSNTSQVPTGINPPLPDVPPKVLVKPRPEHQGSNKSSISRPGSTSRSDTEPPVTSDYVMVDSNVDNRTPTERVARTRSRAQSFSGGTTVRMVFPSAAGVIPDVPNLRNFSDSTMGPHQKKPRREPGYGEYVEQSGAQRHQHGPPTVAITNVSVSTEGPDSHMPGSMPTQMVYEHHSGGITGMVKSFMSGSSNQTPRDREMEKLKAEINKRNIELENHKAEIRRLQRDMRAQINSSNSLQSHRQKLTEANSTLQYELINIKQQLEETKTLADIRGKELIGAQKFLSKADAISISDLKEKVLALNDEIFQAAASLGETIVHQVHGLTEEDMNRLYNEVMQMIGEPVTRMLVDEGQKPNAEANPLLVQSVLQIFMTNVCSSKIELWVPNDPKISDFFTAVYMNIQNAEEPAVSGRWRALTQAHTRPFTDGWKEDLISRMMKVFKVASWRTPDKNQRVSFEGKLVPIFKAVEDLRIALGEKITSSDIHVSLVPPNSRFDASWMDDAFADARAKPVQGGPAQRVVGTTGFGLKKAIVGKRSPSGELMFESVLAPKVTLESTLNEALNPPPRVPKPVRKTTIPATGRGVVNPNSRRNEGDAQSGNGADLA
ncbi:hypothetical protein CVT24_008563 [Panaeolus cyanescens]|uniref:Uncharacterized protein n=1 Tax=Panaeolus cyanescens TaxID=181874 RepID=A0A409VCW1_9AGAR|nr:hypothetical protein CVT24_008563 [Panaeolus cyanescens]